MFDKISLYNKITKIIEPNKVKLDELMKDYTSFKIGGPADILILPSGDEDLKKVIKLCYSENVKPIIIGNGTNLLVTDKGIRGVVVRIAGNYNKIDIVDTKVYAQAGILLSALSRAVIDKSLTGLEFAGGIPGTLGGAIYMNAGAYGGEIKDVVTQVEILDYKGSKKVINNKKMQFSYRNSIIQNENFIVTKVAMDLNYGDIKQIRQRVEELNEKRRKKQPIFLPSAGSTFKRPDGYYAGDLIQKAGLKGYKIGDAQVSDLHAGFIVNTGEATAQNVIDLIEEIKKRIKQDFGVGLSIEVKIIGEK